MFPNVKVDCLVRCLFLRDKFIMDSSFDIKEAVLFCFWILLEDPGLIISYCSFRRLESSKNLAEQLEKISVLPIL